MFTTKKIADTYDQIGLNFSATRAKLSPEVISLLPKLKKDASVLDLGCGNGVILRGLPEGINYTGIDISQVLISEAKSQYSGQNIRFLLSDILDPTVWQSLGAYDQIAGIAVLHHLPKPEDHLFVLNQMKQHLKPDGSIFLSNWRLLQPKFNEFRTSPTHLSIPFHQGLSRDFYAFTDTEIQNLVRSLGYSQTKSFIMKDNLYVTAKLA